MDEIKKGSFRVKFFNKKRLLSVLVLLVALILASVIYIFYQSNRSDAGLASVCTTSYNQQTLNQAAYAISAGVSSGSSLSAYAKDVQDLRGYNKDPNCLYVIFESQMQHQNYKVAGQTLTSIKRIISLNTNFRFYPKFNVTLQDIQSQYTQLTNPSQATLQHGEFLRNPYEKQ